MIESVVGITSAAPTPITARRPINVDGVSAKMAASDAAPNITSPIWRMLLRP